MPPGGRAKGAEDTRKDDKDDDHDDVEADSDEYALDAAALGESRPRPSTESKVAGVPPSDSGRRERADNKDEDEDEDELAACKALNGA